MWYEQYGIKDPYYADESVIIIHDDCRNVLPLLPDRYIDLVLTSPPFNLGNNHHTNNFKHSPYPDDLPEDKYQQQQIDILNLCWRVTRDNGSLFYEHKNRIRDGLQISPYRWLFLTKWLDKQEIVWENRSHNFDPIRFLPKTQRIYWLVKQAQTNLENNDLLIEDLWRLKPEGTQKSHTRAFPSALPERILVCFPSKQIILDPFLGSGTTAYCAKKLGRKAIGIEISKEYCAIAAKRCSQGVFDIR